MMTESTAYEELMPKIQALIASADSSSSKDKSLTDLHPFFRRKGKWHNHDYCDACGEKGKLLCCDICPASFHLLCHDPPLEVVHVPIGPWTCSACNNIKDNKNDLSRKSYKIEFTNYNKTSGYSNRERRSTLNIAKNFKRKAEILPKELPYSQQLRKSNSSYFRPKTTPKVIDSDLSDYVSVSTSLVQNEVRNINMSTSKSNSNCPIDQSKMKRKNESTSSDIVTDSIEIDLTNCDVEVKCETEIEEIGPGSDVIIPNTGYVDVKKRNSLDLVSELQTKFNFEQENRIGDLKLTNFNIQLPNCEFVLRKTPISSDDSEARLLSVKKSCLTKEKNIGSADNRSINATGIEKIFNIIITETKKLNPRQFILPKEYVSDIDKNLLKPEKDLDGLPCDWDSNDLLKVPSRKCYFCRGICLSGQMISCDFCPAHFHLNCLNPPLCSIPDVKWMCPLHPHHILDKVMDDPNSITELTMWWRDFSVSVDSNDVISKFIKRINRFKKISRTSVKTSIKIPDIVKYHYKNPVRRIPELEDLINQKSHCIFEEDFTLVPHELIIKSNNCCNHRQRSKKTYCNQNFVAESAEKEQSQSVRISAEKSSLDPKSWIEITSDDKQNTFNSDLVKSTCKNGENLSTWDPESRSFRFKSYGIYDFESFAGPVQKSSTKIQKSPWEKIEEILSCNIDVNFISGGTNTTKLNSNLKRVLVNEKVNSIISDLPPSFLPDTTPYPFIPPFWNKDSELVKTSTRVRAVLCPLSHRAPLIYMCDGTLSIGSDFSNDVCLLNYGHCNYISRDHAVIFYDKVSKTYELLNYSEFSSVVDGVTYTCDISCPTESVPPDQSTLSTVKPIDETSPVEYSNIASPEKAVELNEKLKVNGVSSSTSISRTKSTGFESRNLFKKLMTDIEKLISKSKKEMTSIAEEDLNEIAKAIKASSEANKVAKESSLDKQKSKKKLDFAVQLKRVDLESLEDHNEIDSSTRSQSVPSQFTIKLKSSPLEDVSKNISDSNKQSQSLPASVKDAEAPLSDSVTKETKLNTVTDKSEATALRRSERKIKRSIFATYRREMRKDKKLELDMLANNSEDEVKIVEEKRSPIIVIEDDPVQSGNPPLSNGLQVPETQEKCRCQVNNLKLPEGRDSSWENSASLHHGSHMRFGCVEFVFCIVNYSTDFKNRSHQKMRNSHSTVRKLDESEEPPSKRPKAASKEDDLSTKLRSLLDVLSSNKSSVSSKSSASSISNSSMRSSPASSRSPSPLPPPSSISRDNFAGLVEINYEDNERLRHEIKTEDS